MDVNNENDYKIIKKIGEGGYGEIYLIEKGNEKYALKKIKSKLTEGEMNEYNKIINILSKMNNKNIIKYYTTFIEKDSFNILMEYGGNNNLEQFIKKYKDKHQLIEENIIRDIIIQICFGLKEIHENKIPKLTIKPNTYIIHRDLTPDNILLMIIIKLK